MIKCSCCQRKFEPKRSDTKTCSDACRQMAYRRRLGVTARCNVQPRYPVKHVRGTFGTGNCEWYTPEKYIDLARKVMGGIDLDPASCVFANETVKATKFYTKEDNGLNQEWSGRIWLNPPYGQPAIAHFADKMVMEWKSGRVTSAIVLTHNYSDTGWFGVLAGTATAICFTRGRIRFIAPSGDQPLGSPTQGQCFFYFGQDASRFDEVFGPIGLVVNPQHPVIQTICYTS